MVYRLVNVAATPCRLSGYPGISLYDHHDHLLPFTYRRGHRGPYVTQGAPRTVVLAPGGSAYFKVAKYRCDVGEITSAAVIQVYPPGERHSIRANATPHSQSGVGTFSYCRTGPGGQDFNEVGVSPVEPTYAATGD